MIGGGDRNRGGKTARRWGQRCGALLSVTALLALHGTGAVMAQVKDWNNTAEAESVEGRSRPEFEPIGIELADVLNYQDRQRYDPRTGLRLSHGIADTLIMYPSVSVSYGYNDNLLRAATNLIADSFVEVQPAFNVKTDWDNHELSFESNVKVRNYLSQKDENFIDGRLMLGGRLDYSAWESFALRLSQEWQHEERGTFNRNFGSRPTTYTMSGLTGIWDYQRDRYFHTLTAAATFFDYNDTDAVAFTDSNQDDRDRWEYTLTERLGYEAFDRTLVYIEPSIGWRRYAQRGDDFGFFRDSSSWQMLVGVWYDFTEKTSMDIAVGRLGRSYDDPRLRDISVPTLRAKLLWNPTEVTTITTTLKRDVVEQIIGDNGGAVDTTLSVQFDWELFYQNIISVGASYGTLESDTGGFSASFVNKTKSAFVAARRHLNEHMTISGQYNFTTREGSIPGSDYTANTWLLKLHLFI